MHTFNKAITFTPLSRGRYRRNQTGQILTKAQILFYTYQCLTQGDGTPVKIHLQPPPQKKKKPVSTHASKYKKKHS